MINNEYYYENSFTVICTKKSHDILEKEIMKNNYRCKLCGGELVVITFMEGTCICCKENIYEHICGYDINYDNEWKKPPKVIIH